MDSDVDTTRTRETESSGAVYPGRGRGGGLKLFTKCCFPPKLNDRWEDGPCRSCRCDGTSSRAVCDRTECAAPAAGADYATEAHGKYGQCCPSYRRVSCVHNGTVHAVGSEWPSPSDPCRTMACRADNGGEASLTESVKSCNADCPLVRSSAVGFCAAESKPPSFSRCVFARDGRTRCRRPTTVAALARKRTA